MTRRAPVNGGPGGTIAWEEHVEAWEAYHRAHPQQSAETIARRGGFSLTELVTQLGRMPRTWEPDPRTKFMRGVEHQPPPVESPALTTYEHETMMVTGDLWARLCTIAAGGRTRDADLAELVAHVHAIQHAILAQAAARAYPTMYRLMGGTLDG